MLKLVIGNKNYSSWSLRAWLALKQTGAPFEEVLIPLDQPTTAREIAQRSPSGRVPCLIDGTLAIWDSLAICEHLAERFPDAGLWPKDPAARAIARSVSAEMHSGFPTVRAQMGMDLRATRPTPHSSPALALELARIQALWADCLQRFGQGGAFLFGEACVADAMFAPVVSRFRTYGVPLQGPLATYADAVWTLPAMQEWAAAARAEPWELPNH
jgi:glutathione S-transferase